uniref:Uncharacterized protein n=1 Tax=mine drainage metagenome TaxID=410659 RepID=E6QDA7_9ZZZZ
MHYHWPSSRTWECRALRPGKHSIHRTAGYVIRTSGGVGGRGREASSYPDWAFSWLAAKLGAWHLLFSVKGHFAFSFFHAKNREYTFMLLIPMVKPNFGWSQKLSWH